MDRYLILVDTNAIVSSNYKISSPILKELLKNGYHKMVISQVCIDESIRNFERKREKSLVDLENAIKEAKRYGIKINKPVIDYNVDPNKTLSEEILELQIKVLRKEMADLELIYRKSIELKKPFKRKNDKEGGGFRDNLIWGSYLTYLIDEHTKYAKIIFVNNDSDFVSRNDQGLVLADDLIFDLEENEIDLNKLKVVANFRDLNEGFLQPKLPDIKEFNEQLNISIKQILLDVIDNYRDQIESSIIELLYNQIDGESTEPNILDIETFGPLIFPRKIGVFDDGSIYIYFTQTFTVPFEYFLSKYEVIDISEEREISIIDSNWNDYVMLVEEQWFANVGFEVILNIDDSSDIIVEESFIYEEIKIHDKNIWAEK